MKVKPGESSCSRVKRHIKEDSTLLKNEKKN